MMLNKDWPTPAPNFYIDERLGKKDRCVLVYPNRPGFKGLVMSGASDPVFMHKPSTFILAINGLIFLNLSSEFLLSQNMGFPYPRDVSYEDGRVYVDDYIANSEPNFPVFDFQFHPPQIGVYQSILIEAAMKDKSYAALVGSEYTASKINAPHSMKTQICTFGAEGAKFHAPSQEVETLELKEEDMKPSREYYSQLYRYRQYDLEVAKTQFPDRRAFLDFLDQYNLGALEQAQKL